VLHEPVGHTSVMADESTRQKKAALAQQAKTALAAGDLIGAMRLKEQSVRLGNAPPPLELYELGRLQEQAMRYTEARSTFDRLLVLAPQVPEIALAAGRLARIGGDFIKARQVLDVALARHASDPNLLSERLQAGETSTETVSRSEGLAADLSIKPPLRQVLAFALASHFDASDDPAKAWHFAQLGNSLYQEKGQSLGSIRAEIKAAKALYHSVEPLPLIEDGPRLAYIIGPPRSGGTLLQSVLCAPAENASLGERGALLPWLFDILAGDAQRRWQGEAPRLQESDRAGICGLVGPASLAVDKTPHHAHVAGPLSRLHPGAVFIDQRRDLRDTLVSIFLQGFKSAFGYAREVASIAEYLVLHRQIIDEWCTEGVSVVVHDHDAFVASPADRGAELFRRLGLPWSDDYLSSAKRSGDYKTFSASRVRQPVSRQFTGKYHRYAQFVGPLPDDLLALLSE